MSLRARLKQKEAIEQENITLKDELNEVKNKFMESEKKNNKYKEHIKEMQQMMDKLLKENKLMKEENMVKK